MESSDPEIHKTDTLQKFLIDPNLTVCKFSVETYFIGFMEKFFFFPREKGNPNGDENDVYHDRQT